MHKNDMHTSEIINYKPNFLSTISTAVNNINILISREESHLIIHWSYLEIEFNVSDDAGWIIANDANVRLVNYGVMALFSSISLETISCKTIFDHFHRW